MSPSFKLQNVSDAVSDARRKQRGYMLITVMLALALLTVGFLTALPSIGQQIRRDREEEMIHRGTAYMRAIQHFYRAFGRYPSRLEDLENTNNRRFLRKRYKDPMRRDPATGEEQDFKLLYQTDILGQTMGLGAASSQGGQQGQSGFNGGVPAGDRTATGDDPGNSSPGSSANASDTEGDSNSSGSLSSNSDPGSNSASGFNGPTGGGGIVGVASRSKAKAIREFYNRTHYNEWLFFYLQQANQPGLLKGPVNPVVPTPSLNGAASGQQSTAGGTNQGSGGTGQGVQPGGQPQAPPQPQQVSGETPPQ